VDDSLLQNKELHMYIESGEWDEAKLILKRDKDKNDMAIFSTSSMGRTVLHVAVIAGREDIVKKLVKRGRHELVKMKDNRGYTALALAAELTGNTNIAKCTTTIPKTPSLHGSEPGLVQDLFFLKTNDDEIPLLLAAAKGHKEMTSYLYISTKLDDKTDKNFHNRVLLLTRCITAEIFGK